MLPECVSPVLTRSFASNILSDAVPMLAGLRRCPAMMGRSTSAAQITDEMPGDWKFSSALSAAITVASSRRASSRLVHLSSRAPFEGSSDLQ
jgi:hypothetical protein